ncbi:hypothetical protein AVEN_70833-1 [Araneus ventricosus]|uniref:Uncharacterized protein n=1 Tax=Araneus ventricosus TaxID=182803 RepID=A0A4Y2NZB6_ARAVE|nr:hypothetical protein AVEN_70833-1 [Araneus ventricosus]
MHCGQGNSGLVWDVFRRVQVYLQSDSHTWDIHMRERQVPVTTKRTLLNDTVTVGQDGLSVRNILGSRTDLACPEHLGFHMKPGENRLQIQTLDSSEKTQHKTYCCAPMHVLYPEDRSDRVAVSGTHPTGLAYRPMCL